MTRTISDLHHHFADTTEDLEAEQRLRRFAAELSGTAAPPALTGGEEATAPIRLALGPETAPGRRGRILPAIAAGVLIAVGAGAVTIAASRHVESAPPATASQATAAQASAAQASAAQASAAQASAAQAAASHRSSSVELVAGTPTPAAAPFTLAWVPAGWKLLTWEPGRVSYASPDRPSGDQYAGPTGNLDISYRSSGPPVQVTGGPVTIVDASPGQGQVLTIRAGAAHTIVIQLPPSLPLNRAQLLQLANGVTLRPNAVPEGR